MLKIFIPIIIAILWSLKPILDDAIERRREKKRND